MIYEIYSYETLNDHVCAVFTYDGGIWQGMVYKDDIDNPVHLCENIRPEDCRKELIKKLKSKSDS